MTRKKLKNKSNKRVIFRVPPENEADFEALKEAGYGDTEILVACLRNSLAEVKAELLEKRAKAIDEQLKRLNDPKAPSSIPRGLRN